MSLQPYSVLIITIAVVVTFINYMVHNTYSLVSCIFIICCILELLTSSAIFTAALAAEAYLGHSFHSGIFRIPFRKVLKNY